MRYRTKSQVVEAVQWDGSNDHEVLEFGQGTIVIEMSATDTSFRYMVMKYDGQTHIAHVDDWLVREADGKLLFYSPTNFYTMFDMSGY